MLYWVQSIFFVSMLGASIPEKSPFKSVGSCFCSYQDHVALSWYILCSAYHIILRMFHPLESTCMKHHLTAVLMYSNFLQVILECHM